MSSNQTIKLAHRAGAALWSELENVRSETCVAGVFAALNGDTSFGEIRSKARQNKTDNKAILASFRNGC